ncbi:MAG: type II toxin-antitoxin system HicB family antitoxin [Chloroflexi bacterium]|nr:type II toxin-antitoxin system HicB family antitoxin [Chloroflexota bacterium]
MRHYTVVLIPDPEEGGYAVHVPALPGCHTQGETIEEALANAKEAIALYLEELDESGEPVPEEATPAMLAVVAV